MSNALRENDKVKYDRHRETWDACINDPEKRKVALTWLHQKNTFDHWRHNRMYSFLEPIVSFNNEFTWLTIGDGRYGTDAHSLLKLGAKKVHCSDISDTLISIGKDQGFINEYSAQNAENLEFYDNQFDFVLCKEAYHHFPRPHIALHEMYRVARIGVILIEPRDTAIDKGPLSWALSIAKKVLRRKPSQHEFEAVGNFVFTISEREIEKFLLGMHKRIVAFNGLNDVYEEGVEFIDLSTTDKSQRKTINKLKRRLSLIDLVTKLGLRKTGIISSILFKSDPGHGLSTELTKSGWQIKTLPANPYI